MKPAKILYITQEITPYLPESEVACACRSLPHATQDMGREIRTFMPKFGSVNERRNQLHEVIRLSGMNIIIDDSDHPLIIKVASIQSARMQVYFIDNDDFFQRRNTVCDENGEEFSDNDDRMIFYVRGVLETVKKLRWAPDIIHCHGWMTALAPLYVKTAFNTDPFFKNTKMVYTLYNDGFKNPFSDRFAKKIKIEGVEDTHIQPLLDKNVSFTDISKFAVKYADAVVQGSETVDSEVLDYIKETGCPFLPYLPIEENADPINKLYDKILGE